MLLLPIALWASFFFLVICGIVDGVIWLLGYFGLLGVIGFRGSGTWIVFGAIWCVSFYCGLRVSHALWLARMPPRLHH